MKIYINIYIHPPPPPLMVALLAIIWRNPTGSAIYNHFQFKIHTNTHTRTQGNVCLKSLIEMDWVIQLTPTHLNILCAVAAFALGYCYKSLSHHRNTPVLDVFIKFNWVDLPQSKDRFFSHLSFSSLLSLCCWKPRGDIR